MKKFYFLMLALIVASFAADAQRWFISGAFNNWNHANASYELKAVDGQTGVYQIQLTGSFGGEFLICQGTPGSPDWNNKVGTNGSKVKPDVAYSYRAGAGNFTMDGSVTDPTITLDTNAKTLLVAGPSAANEYTEVYLVGDFGSGWSETNTSRPLTLKSESGDVQTFEGKFNLTAATTYFKMKAGNLVYGTGGGDVAVVLGTEYTASQSGNAYSIAPGEYTFTFVLPYNGDTGKLTVTAENVTPTYPDAMYILGYVNGNTFTYNNGVEMTQTEEGIYTVDAEVTGQGYFSFSQNLADDWSGLIRWGATANDTPIAPNATMSVQRGEHAFVATPAKYTFTLNLVEKTLTLTPEAVITYPEVMYLIGNVNGLGFAPNNGVEMAAESEGTYKVSEVAIGNAGGGYGYFAFATTLADTAADWSGLGRRYGATENDLEPSFEGSNNLAPGSENSFKVAEGTYTIVLDLVNNSMTIQANSVVIIPDVETPETLYIHGNVNGSNWDTAGGVALSKNGDIFSGRITVDAAAEDNQNGYICFDELNGESWDVINGGNRWGAPANDTPMFEGDASSAEVELTLYQEGVAASACASFVVPAGMYDISVNFGSVSRAGASAPVLSIEKVIDGVDAIMAEGNEAVEYFNLQGVRVAAPEAGLYIRRQGDRVSKVYVK